MKRRSCDICLENDNFITVETGITFNGLWACTVVKVLAQTERDAQKDQPKKGGWWNK